ncbi:MAG: AI-2E family transporter [Candidatus Pacearchaeota archaeon]
MDENFKKTMTAVLVISLLVLSFLILRPIMISIIMALILVFIFSPVYDWLYKSIGNKNLSVTIILLALLSIIVLPLWFLTPVLMRQTLEIFKKVQGIDFVSAFGSIFPALLSSEEVSTEFRHAVSSLTRGTFDAVIDFLTNIILNIPTILLQLTVVFFTFFFVLKEKEAVLGYVKSILPFSKDVEKRLFEYTRGITASILYGQVVIGIVQGVVLGIGLFIFGVPNALFLTLIAMFAGILPIIGTFLVWVPLVILLFMEGSTLAAIGILVFGLISSNIDNFLRPMIVSKRTSIHMAIIMVSMIGGLFFFGILGLLIGPLIISYLLIFLEIYRGKKYPEIITEDTV